MRPAKTRTPRWVWLVIVVLASIEPLTHVWIAHFPPEGAVPTGLHNPDSGVFLDSMRMFRTGFYSPYASCRSAYGTHSVAYFSVPHLWLYGLAGSLSDLLRVDTFLALGVANGLGLFCYLFAVYRFLRKALPSQANLAFLLFTLSGGPGGVLYLLTAVSGLHGAAGFEAYFSRYASYEFMEGALSPVPLAMRLYYTVPFALCYGALAAWIEALRNRCPRTFVFSLALMLLGTFLNIRVGTALSVVGASWAWFQFDKPVQRRAYAIAALAVAVVVGAFAGWTMMRMSPSFIRGTLNLGRASMHLSRFVSAALVHLLIVPGVISRGIRGFPRVPRAVGFALAGYVVAFSVLFCGYQVYYGNILVARDHAAAVAVSDWALIGAALGLVYGIWRPWPTRERAENGWVILWLMLFVSVALSAFGQGWFLRFGPQRLVLMIGLPFSILSASGLQHIRIGRPRTAFALKTALIGCGVCSILVGSLFLQGPLGRVPGQGPFAYCHAEIMSEADARVLDALGKGVVLTPATPGPYFGDVVALRKGNRVINGHGAMNLSDLDLLETEKETAQFFSSKSSEAFRRELVVKYCIDYVLCPDTHPVDDAVLSALYDIAWLAEVAQENKAVLFRVVTDELEEQH
ncbi:MAG TPA: hypothetical protein HPP77_09100 [Candidatus Hydrogenedentes bacterium]|nr:hypothetical protein [Candidatus Hydrogenedentota bacterium]